MHELQSATQALPLTRARRKTQADFTIINTPTTVDDEIGDLDAPHKFGDLVTPDLFSQQGGVQRRQPVTVTQLHSWCVVAAHAA